MANIIDYIKENRDITLDESPLNELDALILARISYLPLDDILSTRDRKTIKELGVRLRKYSEKNNLKYLWKDDPTLFALLENSERFKNLKIIKYINKIDIEYATQFAAVVIELTPKEAFISFRGTDDSVIGWKDDFLMTYKSHTASQEEALRYLESVSKKYDKLILGGHSKGGNFAIYAATFASPETKDKIEIIYNIDGPGFQPDIVETEEYSSILSKVQTFIPQDSIFGRLLNHGEPCTVVKSDASILYEHDIYSWQTDGLKLERVDTPSTKSTFIDKSIKDWFQKIDPESRRDVVEIIFDCLAKTEVTTFAEFKKNTLSKAKKLLESYLNLDATDKKKILETISTLLSVLKTNYFNNPKR